MTRNGELYPLPTQAHHTSATGGGSWHIPTPTSADVYTGNLESSQQSDDSMHSVSLPDFVGRWPTPTDEDERGQPWPTPTASQARSEGMITQMRALVDSGRIPKEEAEAMIQGSLTPDRMKPWAEGKVATPPLALAVRMLPTPGAAEGGGAYQNNRGGGPSLATQVKMWATPRVDDSKNNGSPSQQERHGPALNVQVMLPTPKASVEHYGRPRENDRGDLQAAAILLPTPSSGGESGGPHGIRGGSWAKEKLVETFGEEDAVAMSGGSLSPDWVSWLMGIPIGWTSLEPLPRAEYDQWFQMQQDGTWWQEERGLPRIATGIPDRVNRLKCLGNGIVPASLALFLRGG
jgi:hypothetical protein